MEGGGYGGIDTKGVSVDSGAMALELVEFQDDEFWEVTEKWEVNGLESGGRQGGSRNGVADEEAIETGDAAGIPPRVNLNAGMESLTKKRLRLWTCSSAVSRVPTVPEWSR